MHDDSPFAAIVEAFNADDHDLRVEVLRRCLADDAEVSHVNGVATGPHGFSDDIGQIRQWLPGSTASLTGDVRTVQDWDAQRWALHTSEGALFASGEYVGRRGPDGRYAHLASIPDEHD